LREAPSRVAEESRLSPMARGRAVGAPALVLALLSVTEARGQDPVRRDSLETLPDSVRAVFADSTPQPAQQFPERLLGFRGAAAEVFSCDRDCVQSSTALSLLELLIERVPGLSALRGGYFAGPLHAFEGPYGPGFVELHVDGREVPSLERAQVDLSRLSLTYVEQVRVYREAAGLVIDVDLRRHDAARAYSRISGGTGSPSLQILDGLFANGLGSAFTFEGAFDLVDVNASNVENDRFGAFGRLSWMPWSNKFGAQVEYRTGAVDRSAADTADIRRKEVIFRARGTMGERTQLEAYYAMSDFRREVPGLPADQDPPMRDADVLGLRLSTRPGRGFASVGTRFSGGGAYPSLRADFGAGHPVGPLLLEAGYDVANWTDFSASSWRAAASVTGKVLVPVSLRAFASAGDRGVGFPIEDRAERVGFDATGVAAEIEAGAFHVSGRISRQKVDRALRLGAAWEAALAADSAPVAVDSWEVRVDGPLIPIGVLLSGLEPIRLRGFWRQNSFSESSLLYVPERVVRGELVLHDSFFDGNLQIWLSAHIENRGATVTTARGQSEPALSGGYTWTGGHLMFKIGDFRFFYRISNPAGVLVTDVPGGEFPLNVGVVGLRWEFFH